MTVYGVVIALFKDLPDVEGDSKEDVRTLSVRLGVCSLFKHVECTVLTYMVSQPSLVFKLCLTLLSTAYAR